MRHPFPAHAARFPSAFFDDRARVALLKESYGNRGEDAALATSLANQALFDPLDVAERALAVWGRPNEAAYRRMLDVLRPDNMLAILMAKGLPTDKTERIYATPYSYREDSGAAYTALVAPPQGCLRLAGCESIYAPDIYLAGRATTAAYQRTRHTAFLRGR